MSSQKFVKFRKDIILLNNKINNILQFSCIHIRDIISNLRDAI